MCGGSGMALRCTAGGGADGKMIRLSGIYFHLASDIGRAGSFLMIRGMACIYASPEFQDQKQGARQYE
ncbi:hypothetical protein CSC3H3_19980 [Thalassospira marina]|uniref:Uncharacterized protein n=1 Tax=Thalassospira marina TaxID=2048283 RepID=A0ABM6QDX6_9PROT|nr:hypothetical protein CSC3H3_19980 [Thalassospira marina]